MRDVRRTQPQGQFSTRARQPGRMPHADPRAAALQRSMAPGGPLTPSQVLTLQRWAGNAAVVQRLAHDLEEDQHEHDAGCGHPPTGRPSSVLEVLATPGEELGGPMRDEMEARFGVDLSHLRVHTDAAAQRSAEEIGAEAYTSGHHMVFTPASIRRPRVVAHEIAHTFDQARGPVPGTDTGNGLRMSSPGDAGERSADAIAREVMDKPLSQLPATSQLPGAASVGGGAPLAAGAAPVQRLFRRLFGGGGGNRRSSRLSGRTSHTDSRNRTRASQRGQDADPMERARRVSPPRVGPHGEALWRGGRAGTHFTPGTVETVLARTPSRRTADGIRYECARCGSEVLSRREAERIGETQWYEIDHAEGVIAYVWRAADTIQWEVEVGRGIYRTAEAITAEAASAAANDLSNLRTYCRRCNGGRRAARSESRLMDQSGASWVPNTLRVERRRSASPEPSYASPYRPSTSSGGATYIEISPGRRTERPSTSYGSSGGYSNEPVVISPGRRTERPSTSYGSGGGGYEIFPGGRRPL